MKTCNSGRLHIHNWSPRVYTHLWCSILMLLLAIIMSVSLRLQQLGQHPSGLSCNTHIQLYIVSLAVHISSNIYIIYTHHLWVQQERLYIFAHSHQANITYVCSKRDYIVSLYRSLVQNIVSFIGLFCKRDLSFNRAARETTQSLLPIQSLWLHTRGRP